MHSLLHKREHKSFGKDPNFKLFVELGKFKAALAASTITELFCGAAVSIACF